MRISKINFLMLMMLQATLGLQAKVSLQPIFSNNMVLQQQTQAPIWGEGKPQKKVTVLTSWDNKKYTTVTDVNGHWTVSVATPKAGGPYRITISDGSPVVLNDVLIGEVWICSGQSNMEMPMQGWDIKMNQEEIAQSGKYKNIRLLQVNEVTSPTEEQTITVRNNSWMTCTPENVKDFSATGYFFGKNINESQNVPVGLIMTCWGGTPVEAWTSGRKLNEFPEYRQTINSLMTQPKSKAEREATFQKDYNAWMTRAR
ncbi:MAG: sialate O-acetylesterase, partial [Prevotella sp.]